jgi:hypothetical protein
VGSVVQCVHGTVTLRLPTCCDEPSSPRSGSPFPALTRDATAIDARVLRVGAVDSSAIPERQARGRQHSEEGDHQGATVNELGLSAEYDVIPGRKRHQVLGHSMATSASAAAIARHLPVLRVTSMTPRATRATGAPVRAHTHQPMRGCCRRSRNGIIEENGSTATERHTGIGVGSRLSRPSAQAATGKPMALIATVSFRAMPYGSATLKPTARSTGSGGIYKTYAGSPPNHWGDHPENSARWSPAIARGPRPDLRDQHRSALSMRKGGQASSARRRMHGRL